VVRVNDRGPYVDDRMMDLSSEAAHMLGYKDDGLGHLKVEYIGKAPLEGDDTPMLMASYRPGNAKPSVNDGLPSGVMLAMNETRSPGYSSTFAAPKPQGLPGVRAQGEVAGAATSIDDIIRGAAATPAGRAVSKPTPRPNLPMSVASYAPSVSPAAKSGSVAALAALARPTGAKPQRIELGFVSAALVLPEVRRAAESRGGRLIADSSEGSVSYSLEIPASADADLVLRDLWKAGATDAFVLRD
jgi:rare lipoprotein A